jgi:ribosome-binding factor A
MKEELGEIMQRELEFEKGIVVSIGLVEITPDLARAKVWVDIWPTEKRGRVLSKLRNNSSPLRKELAQQIKLRRVPRLFFFIDTEEIEDDKQRKKVEDILERLNLGKEG